MCARELGMQLSATLKPGMWIPLEAFHEDEDEVWLTKTFADADECGGGCQRRQKAGRMLSSTRFDEGDYLTAVQF